MSSDNVGFRGDAILRDSQGFIWVATDKGLNRYDGYKFRVIESSPDEFGISDEFVYTLFEDKDDFIWIGTHSGLDRYNPHTETFTHLRAEGVNIENASYNSLSQDKHGDIWAFSFNQGIFRFDALGHFKKRYKVAPQQSGLPSSVIRRRGVETQNGNLLFPSSKGIERYTYKSDKFQLYPFRKGESGTNVLHRQKNGAIWVGSEKGLFLFNEHKGEFQEWQNVEGAKPFHQFNIRDIEEDAEGNFWITHLGGGFIKFQPESGNIRTFEYEAGNKSTPPTNSIFDVYIDDAEFLWLGTNIGVAYSPLNFQNFSFFEYTAETDHGVTVKPVNALLATKAGEQWIGSFGGGVTRVSIKGKKQRYFVEETKKNGLTSNTIFTLHEDRNGEIWLGTLRGGLLRFDRENDKFIAYKSPPTITRIAEDAQGNLWLGTVGNGLVYLKPQEQATQAFEHDVIKGQSISALHLDTNGSVWAGTTRGLYIFEQSTNEYQFFNKDSTVNPLIHNFITCFYENKNENTMWVGTAGGISQINITSKAITNYKKERGLLGNIASAIQADTSGRLWIATNNGISLLDSTHQRFINFGEQDGLREIDFTQNTYATTLEGKLQFGSATGHVEFNPEEITTHFKSPKLLLTEFRVFNQATKIKTEGSEDKYNLPSSITKLNHLKLSHRERFFSFEFSTLDALKPKQVIYSYRLEGWDDQWIDTNHTNRIASYTNIPAGTYTLKVRAQDQAGAWETEIKPLAITITPPKWKTHTAYIVYFLALVALIISAIKIRTKHLEKRTISLNEAVSQRTAEIEKQKKTIEELMCKKEEIFTNLSHEFRTPLTLILGPLSQLAQEHKQDAGLSETLKKITANTKRLLRMIEQLLDLSRLDKMPDLHGRTHIDVAKLVKTIVDHFDSSIKYKSLDLKLDLEEQAWISISFDSLEKIIANLLSNAIKYTPEFGKIEIACRVLGNQVLIDVQDNGPGIAEKYQQKVFERFVRLDHTDTKGIPGTGIGLALAKQLTESNAGCIHLESSHGKGTSLTLKFPLVQAENVKSDTSIGSTVNLEVSSVQHFSSVEKDILTKSSETKYGEILQSPKILIIEDHPEMLEYIVNSLDSVYQCLTAEDGKTGEALALEFIPDLIITDLMMPNKNGFEFSHAIRENIKTSHIPILMLTAKGDLHTRKKAWKTNIDEFITKPFDIEELQLRCQNLLTIRNTISERLSQSIHSEKHDDFSYINNRDKLFIENLQILLKSQFQDPKLGAKPLSKALAMSESQLQRKIKGLLNQSVPEYIRSYRLNRANDLLKTSLSISEIAFSVGFSSSTYFSQCFKVEFGKSPKMMRECIDKKNQQVQNS